MAKKRSNKKHQNYTKKDINKQNQSTAVDDVSLDYAVDFAKSFLNQAITTNNPYIDNMILKNLNMNPFEVEKEKLEKMIKNPKKHEKELRDFAEFIENVTRQFNMLVSFYSSILTFDSYLEPINADEEDMNTKSFKNSYKKAINWLDKFDVKKQFPDIMRQILRRDVSFFFVREFRDNIFLQEMPVDYCKIVSKTEYGYQYAFNMAYFFQMGVNIDNYDPVFKEYFEEYKKDSAFQNKYPFWVNLNPIQAPCFKFDETIAGIVPPLMSLFIDSLDIKEFRKQTKSKGELDLYKFIINKIPMHGGDGKIRKAGDYAMEATDAGKFSKVVEGKLPNQKYMKSITTPFESEVINFQRTENGNSEVDVGNKLFMNSSGINSNVMGGDASTATAIKTSLTNAYTYVKHMYPIFERFVNAHLRNNTGKYRWKIHFEGSEYDREERLERAFKVAGGGFPKTFVATALGTTLETVNNLSNLENSFSLVDKLIPVQSSHVQKGENGRPTGKVGESGEKTRDLGTNE